MNRGTVLYVGNFELPDKGASANRVMANRLLFNEIGYKTVYLGITRDEVFDGVRRSDIDDGIFERAYPTSTKLWLERSYSLKDIITVVNMYDDLKAVIFYNSPISLVKKAYRYFGKRDIKVLYDCTEWNSDTEGNKLKRIYKQHDAYRIQHSLDKYVDGLMVISSMMYNQYKKKPKVILPPLVNIEDRKWKAERVREDSLFEFCYAGDPGKKDDLCRLIDAFKSLNNESTSLVIIGVKADEFLAEHPDYRASIKANDCQIFFSGRVPHDKVICQLINTDCFVFVRESNLRNNAGFPTKFAEAYTSGAQIIATDISDIHNYKMSAIQILNDAECKTIAEAMLNAITQKRCDSLRNEFDYRSYVGQIKEFMEFITDGGKEDGNE